MTKQKHLHNNDAVNRGILSKGKDVVKDFDDSQEISVQPQQLKNKLISIRLPMVMIRDLRIIARERGDIGYQQIIKTYIAEGLVRDHQKVQYNILQPQISWGSGTSSSSYETPSSEQLTGAELISK